ncbi:hypothetical protein C8J56DRAFT_882250 [Mycena floridula]|nr:hypothetical protein C8J56DRAFT_882250 [Mycena floridula]
MRDEMQRQGRLDETEWVLAPETSRTIYFFGIVEIEKLSWLSDKAKNLLEEEIDARQSALDSDRKCLKLAVVFADPSKYGTLKVWLRPRTYQVLTMSVHTHKLSQKYLEQWRMHRLFEYITAPAKKPPPVSQRSIDWLVTKTIEYHATEVNYRLIYDPEDPNRGQSGNLRRPRKISRTEVVRIFARHSAWFLAQQLAPKNDSARYIVNMHDWYTFCKKVHSEPVVWGLKGKPRDIDLCEFGGGASYWSRKIAKVVESINIVDIDNDSDGDVIMAAPIRHEAPRTSKLIFDSDFSEESTPPPSDSEYDSWNDDREVLHTLKTAVPLFCRVAPELPPGKFIWDCPDPACQYHIDLLNATKADMENLPQDIQDGWNQFLEERWNATEPHFQLMFFSIVSYHYDFAHIRPHGIVLNRTGKGRQSVAGWLHPKKARKSFASKSKVGSRKSRRRHR